jgi:hypothetical protein
MKTDHAYKIYFMIQEFYNSIPTPKYRNADIESLKDKYQQLQHLKDDLGQDKAYQNLINALSQIISKVDKFQSLSNLPKDKIWSNYSERGMNKVIPPIYKREGQTFPVEWTDKWGYACYVSNGYWGSKNYRVMDALGYMFLLKEGRNCLPKKSTPLFDDLYEIQQRENQLNNGPGNIISMASKNYIRFTDDDFRKFTGLRLSSSEIMNLLLETSRVEFKLTFPVRLKSTGSKENTHRMNYYSRFFEIGVEDMKEKSNGVVIARRYQIVFNTLLGELFVNNLLGKFNDKIDIGFYLLPDSAQLFYRRALLHNNYGKIPFSLATIAEYTGLKDINQWNLAVTVETNILEPLKEFGYIDSYENIGDDPKSPKYLVKRSGPDIKKYSQEEAGSVKDEAGSVKDEAGSVNEFGC